MSLCLFLESINGTLSVKAPEITIQPGDPCSVMFIASVKRGTHHFDIASEGCLTPVSGFGLTPLAAVEDLVGSINKHAAKGGEAGNGRERHSLLLLSLMKALSIL